MAYVTAVNVALPQIGDDLEIGLTGQQWVMLSYSLALASLYLVAGTVADRFGRRQIFIVGTVGFALASALAGAAPNATVLLVARVLQGVAGALLTTGSLALLRSTFDEQQQGRAIGLWTAGTSAVSLAGPPIGGALVEWASWRWLFYLNVPLAIGAVVLAWLGRRPEPAGSEHVGRLDVLGRGAGDGGDRLAHVRTRRGRRAALRGARPGRCLSPCSPVSRSFSTSGGPATRCCHSRSFGNATSSS